MKKSACLLITFLLVLTVNITILNSVKGIDIEYSLSVNIIGSGIVAVNGSSPYEAGSVVQLTATPSDGWEFGGWSNDISGIANPELLLMDSNKSVTCTFTENPEYSLSVNIIGSGIVAVNGSSPYEAGSVVQLTATPSDGWEFGGWSNDISGIANPELLLMDSNKSVTCTFTENPEYSLSVNIIGSGIVAVNGSSPYEAGSVVQLTATPSDGWEFGGWSNDISGIANPELLLMDSNKSVTCTFTENPEYSLSVNIIGSGIVAVNGSSPYEAGSVVQLTATPSDGWEFGGWSNDISGIANPELLLMDSNKSVTCTFTENPEYSLSVNIIGSGIVAVNGSSPYEAGSVVQLTATPSDGWEFGGWSNDISGIANPELLLMDSNKSVTCTFTENPEWVHDVEAVSQTVCDNEILPGDLVDIYVTVRNNGNYTESFDLSCYYDSIEIGIKSIEYLTPGESRIITFTWNTTGIALNIYQIKAWADSSAEIVEIDEANNECTMKCPVFVVPELPIGTIMASITMFVALIGYAGFKSYRTKEK